MKNMVKKLILLCIVFLLVIPTQVNAASNSISFEKGSDQNFIEDFIKINNSLIYVENKYTDGMVIRYFDAKTLKQKCKVTFDKVRIMGPILAENYFIVNTLNGKDSSGRELYNRILYDVKTGDKQVLATKIDWNGLTGHVYNNTVFVFGDAIYDFDKKFSLTNIKTLSNNFYDVRTILNYEIEGKRYLFCPKDLSLTAYPDEDNISLSDYILSSEKYGFIYIKDNSVYWQKTDRSTIKICSYQRVNDDVSKNVDGLKQYGFNSTGDSIYIINSLNSYVVIDTKTGTFKSFSMSDTFHGMEFGPNNKNISLLYNFEREAQQQWITKLTYLDSKGKNIFLSEVAYDVTFFKNFIVYYSNIQPMGMMDIWTNQISVYNTNTGEKIVFNGEMCSYYTDGEKLYARVEKSKSIDYIFDIKKKTFIAHTQTSVKKYIGYGIYMVQEGAKVTFQDKKNNQIAYYSGIWIKDPVCAILPGSKKGFLYNGTNLKVINLPDAKRYTKSNEIKVLDGYLSYSYPVVVKGTTHTYIRILKV